VIFSSKTLVSGRFPAKNIQKRKNNLLWGLRRAILNYIQTMKQVQYSNLITAPGCRENDQSLSGRAQRPIRSTARQLFYKEA
jgi:hypothetical protein